MSIKKNSIASKTLRARSSEGFEKSVQLDQHTLGFFTATSVAFQIVIFENHRVRRVTCATREEAVLRFNKEAKKRGCTIDTRA